MEWKIEILSLDWIPKIIMDFFKIKSEGENFVDQEVGSYYEGYADFYEKFLEEI